MEDKSVRATTPPVSPPGGAAAAGAAAADDAFGADLYRLLTEHAPDTVFSPVSVAGVLRTALCGARGRTAAATAVTFQAMAMVRLPPPVTVIVDRPFLFAIIHTPTGLPLFVGQVSQPRPR